MRNTKGFTLIELMIVVAIVGLLAAVGVSAYFGYVESAKRTEAQTALVDISSKEEAYMNTWGEYLEITAWNPANMPTDADPVKEWSTATSHEKWEILGFAIAGASRWSYAVDVTDGVYTVGACRVSNGNTISLRLSSENRRTVLEGESTIITGFTCPK